MEELQWSCVLTHCFAGLERLFFFFFFWKPLYWWWLLISKRVSVGSRPATQPLHWLVSPSRHIRNSAEKVILRHLSKKELRPSSIFNQSGLCGVQSWSGCFSSCVTTTANVLIFFWLNGFAEPPWDEWKWSQMQKVFAAFMMKVQQQQQHHFLFIRRSMVAARNSGMHAILCQSTTSTPTGTAITLCLRATKCSRHIFWASQSRGFSLLAVAILVSSTKWFLVIN